MDGAAGVALVPASGWPGYGTVLVYALSFWHYPLYVSACRFGRPAFRHLVRASMALKFVALGAFAAAMASVAWPLSPLVVMVTGFALNARAAAVLGLARTYYGWELGEVAFERCREFPYSMIGHPMLLGNVLGFGGALLNAEFLAQWWPLALLHVVGNLGLLLVEMSPRPARMSATVPPHIQTPHPPRLRR